MKTILRIGLAATFAAMLFIAWHTYKAAAVDPSPSREIYIHGTPVCIFQEGENVLARIGKCRDMNDEDAKPLPKAAPYHDGPSRRLPPGHPPVDEQPFKDGRRVIPI